MATTQRTELERLAREFNDAFNRNDLDAVMAFFAEDAIYDEFHGAVHRGKAAIREALGAQFRGDFGVMTFHEEDLFVDDRAAKVLAQWLVTLEVKGQPTSWRGLDVVCFDAGLVREKRTYAKAKVPLLASRPG